jgi:hypothetical protein
VAEQNQQQKMPDDPRAAAEEGDVQATGRSRGHVVDREDPHGPTRTDPDKKGDKDKDSSQHWESGRQRAN